MTYDITYEEFKSIVSKFNKLSSSRGVFYSHIKVDQNRVYYRRDDAQSPEKIESIDLQNLYNFYNNGIYTTTNAKSFELSGKQSPSVAIVKAVAEYLEGKCNHTDNIQQKQSNKPVTNKTSFLQSSFSESHEMETVLMDETNLKKVKALYENQIPIVSGIYVIRINDIKVLPEEFSKILEQKKHNILYIGKAEESLRKRLWGQELHSKGAATFFRSMGAILGYRPPKNSLSLKSRNYKFHPKDTNEIIKWMEENLIVNYICLNKKALKDTEEALIKKHIPLVNIKHNPCKSKELKKLRELCVNIARSK